MTPSLTQAFEIVRSVAPVGCEAVIVYRRKQFYDPTGRPTSETKIEYETGFAFHYSAATAKHFFDRVESLARQRRRDEVAAVMFIVWKGEWAVADAFELES